MASLSSTETPQNAQTKLIPHCVKHLQSGYCALFGDRDPAYADAIEPIATRVLAAIAQCDAPYHNLEHTLQVVLVGEEILSGKHRCEEPISPSEWFNFIVSLLCHDIGYLKGICRDDCPEKGVFVTGVEDKHIILSPEATGASLTPCHVDRGKLFVAEALNDYPTLDVATVQRNIELTRFPVPKQTPYEDTLQFPGLARAADLIGQLADPAYLMKLPALFREFEETGANKFLGYHNSQELRAGYPRFYWQNVSLYLKHGIRYLEMTQAGQATLANLYGNRSQVEKELDRFYKRDRTPLQKVMDFIRSEVLGFIQSD